MEAQPHRFRILRAEALFHDLRVAAAQRAEFRDLFEEVGLANEEKREPRRELVDLHPGLEHFLDVDDHVRERESRFV